MLSACCRVAPAQDRPEEPSQRSLLFPMAQEPGTAGTSFPTPASEAPHPNKATVVASRLVGCFLGQWAPVQAGQDSTQRQVLGSVTAGRATVTSPGRMRMLLPLHPPKTSLCQHMLSPVTVLGGCRIKPLILLPFNPLYAAAAPTSSQAPLPI